MEKMIKNIRQLTKGIILSVALLWLYEQFFASVWVPDGFRWVFHSVICRYVFSWSYILAVFAFLATYIVEFCLAWKNRKK